MPVSHPHILYVGTTAYDLRKVTSVVVDQENPNIVWVRFQDENRTTVPLPRIPFETAWQASLDLLIPNPNGGGPMPPGQGDVSGTYPLLSVVGLRNVPIAHVSPQDGYILRFSASQNAWVPQAMPNGITGTPWRMVHTDSSGSWVTASLIATNGMSLSLGSTALGSERLRVEGGAVTSAAGPSTVIMGNGAIKCGLSIVLEPQASAPSFSSGVETPGAVYYQSTSQAGFYGRIGNVWQRFSMDGHAHDASDIVSGIIDTSRLGAGVASGDVFLAGDSQWKPVDWSIIANKPLLYPPDTHTHALSDIVDGAWSAGSLIAISSSSPYQAMTIPVTWDDATQRLMYNTSIFARRIVHVQESPALVWSITHNFGYYPVVVTLNSQHVQIHGTISHQSVDVVTIAFSEPQDGLAILL